jgi:hypothetical protein
VSRATAGTKEPTCNPVTALFGRPEDHFDARERELNNLEPAWAKASLAFRALTRYGHEAGSVRGHSLIKVNERLNVFKKSFQKGESLALLRAVYVCAEENVPLPTWLAIAYREALDKFFVPGVASSLDQVFNSQAIPTSTAKRHAAALQDFKLGSILLKECWKTAREDPMLTSIDEVVERVLAAQKPPLGIEKTKARRLFERAESTQIEHLRAGGSSTQPLSHLFKERRKSVRK